VFGVAPVRYERYGRRPLPDHLPGRRADRVELTISRTIAIPISGDFGVANGLVRLNQISTQKEVL